MKGMMKLLAAANLITLSEEEQRDVQSQHIEESLPPVESSNETTPVLTQYAGGDVVEERDFDEIFANANIPISPYPAERLLRLLDGLREMDELTRNTAVRAIDSADDSWTIADPIIDAQRKIAALDSYTEAVNQQVTDINEKVVAEIGDLKTSQAQVTTEIRKQISELEQLLGRKTQETTEHVATLEAGLKETREAAARERQRVSIEIGKLQQIPAQFAHPSTHQ